MAEFIQKDMSGAIFKNAKKVISEHPDYTGSCTIRGEKLSIAAWIKEGTKGKFMSLAFSEPYSPVHETRTSENPEQPDEDIPF
jgi:hypothetical protein